MAKLWPASRGNAGSVVWPAGTTTVLIVPHVRGFQALGACLPPLVRGAPLEVSATVFHAVAEVRPHVTAGEGTAHA